MKGGRVSKRRVRKGDYAASVISFIRREATADILRDSRLLPSGQQPSPNTHRLVGLGFLHDMNMCTYINMHSRRRGSLV